MNPLLLTNAVARRLFLDRHLLRPQPSPAKGADLLRVLTDLGFVQVDSVNTLARAHDLIYRHQCLATAKIFISSYASW